MDASAILTLASVFQKMAEKYRSSFYGNDDGSWEKINGLILSFRKEGYDWEMIPSMSSQNDWKNFSVEGATEHHQGFRKALNEIVEQNPELLDFLIHFDGPYIKISDLLNKEIQSLSTAKFYHGTSLKAWEKIKTEGLRPRSETGSVPIYGGEDKAGRTDAIYLTSQISMANFAANDAAKYHKSSPAVLEIEGLDDDLFIPDEDSNEDSPEMSLQRLGSVGYVGTIPPSKIRLL